MRWVFGIPVSLFEDLLVLVAQVVVLLLCLGISMSVLAGPKKVLRHTSAMLECCRIICRFAMQSQ